MELDKSTIRDALGIKGDLEYFIDRAKLSKLKYLDVKSLEATCKTIETDIKNYEKKQRTECEALKPGAIIRISDGDGVSYSQRDYYSITSVKSGKIHYDLISVVRGDYGNEIKVSKTNKMKIEDFIEKYNKHYHKDNISVEEWYKLMRYSEEIPWDGED
jgi:hypothetical protein